MLRLSNLINKNVFISEKHQGKANWPDVDREISLVVPDPTVPSPTQLCFCSLPHSDKPINVTQTYHIIAWKHISIDVLHMYVLNIKTINAKVTVLGQKNQRPVYCESPCCEKKTAVMTTRRILPRVDCVVHDDHAVD